MTTVYQENQSNNHLFYHQKESSYVQALSVNINIPIPSDSVIISKIELQELKKLQLAGVYWSMKDLEKSLGHSTIETTYKHYSHVLKQLREEEEKLAIETFENM